MVGIFLVMFPVGIVSPSMLGENTVFLNVLFLVPMLGFVLYYRKRKEYSSSIRKIVKISAMIIPLVFVGAIIVGVAMGVNNALFPPSYENTRNIDVKLVEKNILDWVNTNRYKNSVGGVNLDDTLDSLAEIRKADIVAAPSEMIEEIGNMDSNIIAKREGIKCMIDDKSANINSYVLIVPHNDYPDIEKLTNYLMTSMINDEEPREIVFAPNVTKTGINSFITKEHLVVIQNFC